MYVYRQSAVLGQSERHMQRGQGWLRKSIFTVFALGNSSRFV